MIVPFDYKSIAIGADFITRNSELNALTNLLSNNENIAIYGIKGCGKSSLIRNLFLNIQKTSLNLKVCEIDMVNIRRPEQFQKAILEQVIENGGVVDTSDGADPYMEPERLAQNTSSKVVVYLKEFQSVLNFDDPYTFLKEYENVCRERKNVCYIFSGSKVNAMKHIFEEKKYFYNLYENVPLLPLNKKLTTDYIIRVFLKVGRVIDKDFTEYIYDLCESNPFYMWQIASNAFNMTKGYVTKEIVEDSINFVLSTQSGYFRTLVDSLSNFQLSLLRAVFNGETKFGTQEVIMRYKLNTSANVHRLKEALKKKEIITFDEKDEPHILDPMFKLWLTKYFFV